MTAKLLHQALRATSPRSRVPSASRGVTLVELMVALVLGLIIVGAVLNVFLSSRQTFRVNENLGRLQENARIGFELLARDIRETGATPCGIYPNQVANVIRVGGVVPWWASWWAEGAPLRGFEGSENAANADELAVPAGIVAIGTGTGKRVANTDSLITISSAEGITSASAHDIANSTFTLNSTSGFSDKNAAVVCDLRGAAIFQIDSIDTGAKTIEYNGANNCTTNIGTPINAGCTSTTPRTFSPSEGIQVANLSSNFWYIGNNEAGTRSLFRRSMINPFDRDSTQAKDWAPVDEEVIPGVSNMQIQYLTADTSAGNALASDWVDANNSTTFPFPASGTQVRLWDSTNNANQVVAVKIQLTIQTDDSIGTDNAPVTRVLNFVVGVRSRNYLFS